MAAENFVQSFYSYCGTGMWPLVTVLLILLTLYSYLTRYNNYWKNRNVPYVKPTFLFGNFLSVIKQKEQLSETLKTLYESTTSPYLGFFIFDKPYLLIRDLDIIKKVLISDFDCFMDRTVVTNKNDVIGSKLLFLLKGQTWKELRRSALPLFNLKKLKNMIPLINKVGNDLVQHIDKNVDKNELDCRSVGLNYGVDVISSCAFGFEADALKTGTSIFVQASLKLFEISLTRGLHIMSCFFSPILAKLLNVTFCDVDATNTLSNIFYKVCQDRELSAQTRGDFVDIMNKASINGVKLNNEYMAGLAIQMLLAGHETTGTTVSFLLYELCCHVDMQNRLREEIENVLNDYKGEISDQAINEMKYLDMILNETLRKYPILGFLDRKCLKNYKLPGTDLIIEKGTPVFIPLYALHYDDRYFPNPDEFKPERFSESNRKSIPSCAYMPFGEGRRFCIGKPMALINVKVAVIKILLNFKVESCKDTPKPVKFEPSSMILCPQNGELKIKFTRI